MKTVTPELLALLATRQFATAYLFTFTLVDGTVLRYTDGDINITSGGNVFKAGGETGPFFNDGGNAIQFHWNLGLQVNTTTFDVLPGTGQVEGVGFLVAVKQGAFRGATCQIEQAFMATYGDTSVGTVICEVGLVAEIDAGRSVCTFNIKSHTVLLNQNFPKNLFQPGCGNSLYDGSCTLIKASFGVSGAAAVNSTISTINTSSLSNATDYFTLGSIKFTSGANAGVERGIKTYTHGSPSIITLMSPFPVAPAAADAFTIYPGCDKTQATCSAKFNNLANFRGYPYVPQPETAI